jgi:allophanate hydrolase
MLTIAGLRRDYQAGTQTPAHVIARLFACIEAEAPSPIWISLADKDEALARASRVDLSLPLAGVPFAVKDNIDVAGMRTTAACPSFAYDATRSATVVGRLMDAGAILIGKTNMDQFATGLTGMRTPYGECSSVFDPRYISGGSSSGSAVAVARGLCAFSLGTDTAGSGRVPAAFNNIIGLKPTRGVLSTTGVVPACRSLDCVSVFATTAADTEAVWRVAAAFDGDDPYSRPFDAARGAAPWLGGPFRFGMPQPSDLEFFGDTEAAALYASAAERLEALGGVRTRIDFGPFREAAAMLYAGPWIAERLAAVGAFVEGGATDVHPIVAEIIGAGSRYSAADAFRGAYRLEQLRRDASKQWDVMDVMLLPTAATIYTREAVRLDPVRLNSNLGHYTNFVNLMDLAAIAVPAGFRANGLPFGVSLVGPACSDPALIALAGDLLGERRDPPASLPGCVSLAVVGAHLTGQPLNHQLTDRGARLMRATRTSREYRLFALADTDPPKPGLVREENYDGPGVDVEVWAIPEHRFGGFVAAVPSPLSIGNVRLNGGGWVKGFLCEAIAVKGAIDITHFGGWKQYRESSSPT